MNKYKKIIVRNNIKDKWKLDYLVELKPNAIYPFSCFLGCYRYGIPYEENKEIIGTTKIPLKEFDECEQ